MMGIQDSNARWRTLLQENYLPEIQVLATTWPEQTVLPAKFVVIQAADPDFAQTLIEHPKALLRSGTEALRQLCREGGWDIDPMLRILELPNDCRRALRDVGSDDIDRLVSSEVIVTKVSELKPRIYHADFRCEVCNHVNPMRQLNELELIEPIRCEEETGGCGRNVGGKDGTRFELVAENRELVDNQWIEIQELPENVKAGAQPARATVLAEADLANSLIPGMRVTANLVPFIRSEVKRTSKTPLFNIYHTLISVEKENTPFNEIVIADEDVVQIKKISQRRDLFDLLTDSIAPSIFGAGKLRMVKRSLALQLFGGVSRRYSDATRARGDIHILLMGDPGVAKSQLLEYMGQISPRGRYASGGGVSGAGLTAAAVRDTFSDGRFSLEAGVLVLADSGLAAIDEFDKMSNEDRARMHEAMEQQKIHISKGGINASMRTRCAILAAANPKHGRFTQRMGQGYDITPMFDEVDLPPALMSRFDIIWLLRDDIIKEQDTRIAQHILANRTAGVSEILIDEEREIDPRLEEQDEVMKTGYSGEDQLTIPMYRKYVAYAKRNFHPTLDEVAKQKIVDFYLDTRGKFTEDDNSIPITARGLEGLIRLSEASARARLSDVADERDADLAIAMYRNWRYELMGDEFDEGALLTGRSAKRRNAEKVLLEVMRTLCGGRPDTDMEQTAIYNQMLQNNFSEDETDVALQRLAQHGEIFNRTAGIWRLVTG